MFFKVEIVVDNVTNHADITNVANNTIEANVLKQTTNYHDANNTIVANVTDHVNYARVAKHSHQYQQFLGNYLR